MKRFFKVRLLPVCLLLVMLFQSLPVFAEGERVYHLDTAYASERLAYGTVEPIDTGAAFTSHSYYDQLESDLQRTIYEAVCNTLPGDPAFTLETSEIPTFILPAEGPTQEFQQQVMDFIASQVLPAYAAASLDDPLLFWMKGVQYGGSLSIAGNQVSSITIQCNPESSGNFDREGYQQALTQVLDVMTSLESSLEFYPEYSVYDELKFFHDHLCQTVSYVDGKNAHNVAGPLLEGLSVCEGYAKAFKLFCNRMNIPCVIVTGAGYTDKGAEAHAWNAVRMEDGNWYAVDVTWDDQTSGIFYDFFLVGGESVPEHFTKITFHQSHVARGDFYGNGKVMLEYPTLFPEKYDPSVEHIHVFESIVTPPTCTEDGYTVFTCACGMSYQGEVQPAFGHSYTTEVFFPTCTEEGYTLYTCETCGHSYAEDYSPVIDHPFGEWTEVAPGKEERVCDLCGKTETRDKAPAYDANGDGVTTEADVQLLLELLVGNAESDTLFDLDGDGVLTVYDCVLLLQIVQAKT